MYKYFMHIGGSMHGFEQQLHQDLAFNHVELLDPQPITADYYLNPEPRACHIKIELYERKFLRIGESLASVMVLQTLSDDLALNLALEIFAKKALDSLTAERVVIYQPVEDDWQCKWNHLQDFLSDLECGAAAGESWQIKQLFSTCDYNFLVIMNVTREMVVRSDDMETDLKVHLVYAARKLLTQKLDMQIFAPLDHLL